MYARMENFRKITNFGVIPDPAGAGAVLLQSEEGYNCHLVFWVARETDHSDAVAIMTVVGCRQSVFGYPNDEAWGYDQQGNALELSYGFYEVLDSDWAERLAAYNRRAFPSVQMEWGKHFFIACHDGSAQFLAQDLRLEIFDGSFDEAIAEAARRTPSFAQFPGAELDRGARGDFVGHRRAESQA
jgi:hypothetical protein